jgi:hypothetical protein
LVGIPQRYAGGASTRPQPPDVNDLAFVQRVLAKSCPNNGRRHVIIELASFSSSHKDNQWTYHVRVPCSHKWLLISPKEIANTEKALSHPTNMNVFYQAYSPYVDIKFIVLHQPFLETIASHCNWNSRPLMHLNIIRGFMLMLQ